MKGESLSKRIQEPSTNTRHFLGLFLPRQERKMEGQLNDKGESLVKVGQGLVPGKICNRYTKPNQKWFLVSCRTRKRDQTEGPERGTRDHKEGPERGTRKRAQKEGPERGTRKRDQKEGPDDQNRRASHKPNTATVPPQKWFLVSCFSFIVEDKERDPGERKGKVW
jgi:hypothetical protein